MMAGWLSSSTERPSAGVATTPAHLAHSFGVPGLLLATTISGVLYALAFPTVHLQVLAWVALVPFFVAVRRAPTLPRAAVLGWLWMTVMGWDVHVGRSAGARVPRLHQLAPGRRGGCDAVQRGRRIRVSGVGTA